MRGHSATSLRPPGFWLTRLLVVAAAAACWLLLTGGDAHAAPTEPATPRGILSTLPGLDGVSSPVTDPLAYGQTPVVAPDDPLGTTLPGLLRSTTPLLDGVLDETVPGVLGSTIGLVDTLLPPLPDVSLPPVPGPPGSPGVPLASTPPANAPGSAPPGPPPASPPPEDPLASTPSAPSATVSLDATAGPDDHGEVLVRPVSTRASRSTTPSPAALEEEPGSGRLPAGLPLGPIGPLAELVRAGLGTTGDTGTAQLFVVLATGIAFIVLAASGALVIAPARPRELFSAPLERPG